MLECTIKDYEYIKLGRDDEHKHYNRMLFHYRVVFNWSILRHEKMHKQYFKDFIEEELIKEQFNPKNIDLFDAWGFGD